MVKYDFWMWCSDCKVFMELGNYMFEEGHFEGPWIPMENRRTGNDWALRRFLEEHTGHRIGLEQDVELRFDDCPIKHDWKHIQPLTGYCMVFKELDELVEKMTFPPDFKRALFIVDVYDWAWDIASRELLCHWTEVEGTIIDMRGFFKNEVDPAEYDIIFVYPWGSTQLMDKLDPRKTVVCVAGGEQVKLEAALRYNCSKFKFFGACNTVIKKVLEGWFPKRSVVLLSHGVETDLFKPHPIPHEGFVVGWAGSMERDLKRFPKAKEITKEAGVALNVAGYKTDGTHKPHSEMPYFYNCLPPFELIVLENECKPISKIKENDKVLTHKGRFRRVVKTFKFPKGKMIEIKTALSPKTQLTEDHPVLIYQPQIATHRIKNTWGAYRNWVKHKKREKKLQKYKLSWVKARELKRGDIIAYPIISGIIDKNVSNEQLEFYGYFAGDGYTTTKKSYRFGISVGNKENLDKQIQLFKKATGFDPHLDKTQQKCTTLYKNDKKTTLKLRKMFGEKALNKRLPQWCMYLSKEKQKHILAGLIESDGHIRFDNRHIYTTISSTLASQVKQLILRQGMIPVVSYRKPRGRGKNNVWRVEWNPTTPHRNYMSADLIDGYLLLPIHNIKNGDYFGAVYNIEVEEDNSYVTTSLAVHNSCDVFLVTSETEAHPMVVYEAMSCGIPVIATNVGDIPENIVDGYNGFILDVEAPVSDFVEKITLLRESPGLRKKMGVRARNTILQKWTWDKVVDQYRNVGRTMNE